MTRAVAPVAAFAALFLASGWAPPAVSPAMAQLTDWRSVGPEGASILALATRPGDPATRVAAGYAALFTSADGGQNWTRGGAGIAVPDVGAVHVAGDGVVYAGTYGAGVYRSTDGGANFLPANTGMESAVVFVLAADLAGRLWAGLQSGSILLSTDGGAGWESRSNGLPAAEVHDILPVSGDSLFAATLGGVFLSTDAGLSWSPRNSGLNNLKAVTLARRPGGGYLYAGTTTTTPEESGVYRSTDDGQSWGLSTTGLTNLRLADILIDAGKPDIVYAGTQVRFSLFTQSGIYRSTNAGASWALVPGNPAGGDVRVLAQVGSTVIAGLAGGTAVRGGVFSSSDGQLFQRSDRGIVAMRCRTVATFPGLADEVLTGATGTFREPGGAYRSLDGGGSWEEYSNGNLNPAVNVICVASPTLRYAGTGGGVWRRSAGSGDTWQVTAISSGQVHDLAMTSNPDDSLLIYAATANGVFFSLNGGASFIPMNNGLTRLNVQALVIDPTTPELLYAGTDSAGVFHSTDGGLGWSPLINGLASLDVRDLAFDADGHLFSATSGGLFELVSGLWEARNDGLTDLDLRSLAIYRTHRFVASAGGVFRQIGDSTMPWSAWNPGLPTLDVRAVYADTARGRLRLFACAEGFGLYQADQPTPVLLARLEVEAAPGRVELRFAPANPEDVIGFRVERRLAGEYEFMLRSGEAPLEGGPEYRFVDDDARLAAGSEAWYRLVAIAANGELEFLPPFPVAIPWASAAAPRPALAANPNPFSDRLELGVTGGKGGVLRIQDVTGRTVRTLRIDRDGLLRWDGKSEGREVASGFYFLTLDAPGGKATARVVKLR